MLRIVLTRALLAAIPFGLYFLWAMAARRSGRPMGSTPWGWLAGVGGVLVGVSLMLTAVLHQDNRGDGYVPAQAHPDGKVTPLQFDPAKGPRPVGAPEPNTAP